MPSFRFVDPVQQLLPNDRPVLFQVVTAFINGHPIDAGAALVAPHLPQCFLQVLSLTYLLHDSTRVGWAFGLIRHRERFDVSPSRLPGFTRRRRCEPPPHLGPPPLVPRAAHLLLPPPLDRVLRHRSRPTLSNASPFPRGS